MLLRTLSSAALFQVISKSSPTSRVATGSTRGGGALATAGKMTNQPILQSPNAQRAPLQQLNMTNVQRNQIDPNSPMASPGLEVMATSGVQAPKISQAARSEDYFGDNLPIHNDNAQEASEDEDIDEECGADPDASIRPITPSSIDAASSFTGSTSLNSQAPTSRTFKSFVTGHSKTSGSTKPNTMLSITGAASPGSSSSPPPSQYQVYRDVSGQMQHVELGEQSSWEGGSRANMTHGSANRIATSLHSGDGTAPTSPQHISFPTTSASTLTVNTPVEPSGRAAMSAGIAKASPLRNSYTGSLIPPSVIALAEEEEEEEKDNSRHERRITRTKDGEHILPSSSSITFSALPPLTPSTSLYYLPSTPNTPLLPSNASVNSISQDTNVAANLNYPRHSAPNPKNNPRASSPPPDNSSTLTLASSTGRSPSIHTSGPSKYTIDRGLGRSGIGCNEDASIRAIAPSRRESDSSMGSRWSAAVLSNKDYIGSVLDADNASLKRKTPSMKTVATASSYYATPQVQPAMEAKG